MKKGLIVLLSILIGSIAYSLEVERATPIELGRVISGRRARINRASEIWVKGIAGKKVKLEYPQRVRREYNGIEIDIYKINLRRDVIVLDSNGRGKFEMSVELRGKGDGEIYENIDLGLKYVK